MIQRHGWTLFALPSFVDQLEKLVSGSRRVRLTDPVNWHGNANVKSLATLTSLILERIPHVPLGPEFRQGNMLGPAHRHWFRAKFGANRFRLFFRADSGSRVIIYVWVNDRDTLRKAGASTDPYAVFASMLNRGNPPNDWSSLFAEAQATQERFTAAVADSTRKP